MRKDERLRTIYETIAPHITRTEGAWREYIGFAARFFKRSFDNVLLVYAQNPNVTLLATVEEWNRLGRFVNSKESGLAVCEYENARLSLKHLFDISQTHGREIKPTDWQLGENIKAEIVKQLAFSHGFETSDFSELLHVLAAEAVGDNYEEYLQDLNIGMKDHLFSELPEGGFELQFIQLLTDSVYYFIGKRCFLPDEELHTGDGMVTIGHFNTLPLVTTLGDAVTSISKNILLEMERTIKIINKERGETHEQTIDRAELHRERRSAAPEPSNLQQQRGRQPAPGQVRQNGNGVSARKLSTAVYDFENGWHTDGENAPGTQGSGGENRTHHPANAGSRTDAGNGGHPGEDPPPEQPAVSGGGNRAARDHLQSEVSPPPLSNQTIEPSESEQEPPDGSFFVPETQSLQQRQADRINSQTEQENSLDEKASYINIEYTDEQVREYYESILKSTDLYPVGMYEKIQALFATDMPLGDKAVRLSEIYEDYGNAEYQADVLLKTTHRGENGMSFYFGDGYTHIPWHTIASIVKMLIDEGEYPAPVPEESIEDSIGDYNIPDEVDEMHSPDMDNVSFVHKQDGPDEQEGQKPFEYEQRLNEYSARQAEIDTRLEFRELQKQEEVIFDEKAKAEEIDDKEELEAEYA